MRKIVFFLSPDLKEDGELYAEGDNECFRLIDKLQNSYKVVLVLRKIREKRYHNLPKYVDCIYDDTVPDYDEYANVETAMQAGVLAWDNISIDIDSIECAIAWQGLNPWSIAALRRTDAQRKIINLYKKPSLFISVKDIDFFVKIYSEFDAMVCASESVEKNARCLFGSSTKIKKVGWIPDTKKIIEQTTVFDSSPFDMNKLNIVTAHRLAVYSQAETIPKIALTINSQFPDLCWYIFGEGERKNHIIQDIVKYDVCEHIVPMGNVNNIFTYVYWSDGLVNFEDGNEEVLNGADWLGIPVLNINQGDKTEKILCWLANLKDKKSKINLNKECRQLSAWKRIIEGEE